MSVLFKHMLVKTAEYLIREKKSKKYKGMLPIGNSLIFVRG